MIGFRHGFLACFLLLCSGFAFAQDAERVDDLKLDFQACSAQLDKQLENKAQEREQINKITELCAQQYQDEKQEAKCLINAIQQLAQHDNAEAAEFLAKLYSKVNKNSESQKWAEVGKTIMNKKFPECA